MKLVSASRLGEGKHRVSTSTINTPSEILKRKAGADDRLSNFSKKAKITDVPDAAFPATPQTNPSSPQPTMESEDDYVSDGSTPGSVGDALDSDEDSFSKLRVDWAVLNGADVAPR